MNERVLEKVSLLDWVFYTPTPTTGTTLVSMQEARNDPLTI